MIHKMRLIRTMSQMNFYEFSEIFPHCSSASVLLQDFIFTSVIKAIVAETFENIKIYIFSISYFPSFQ